MPRDFRLPIGKPNEWVVVDTSSTSELDTLQEILVDMIYPIDRIGIDPVMILDCGANVGYFSSLARIKFPNAKIVCWEPDAYNYSRLVSQPLLRTDGVMCIEAAVSDFDGWANLCGAGTGGTLTENLVGQRVRAVDLSRWIDRNCISPLLVKMDIEGHERRVLRALKDHWISPCVLFLETHQDDGDDTETIDGLVSAGFHIEHLRTHSLSNDPRIFKEYMCQRT